MRIERHEDEFSKSDQKLLRILVVEDDAALRDVAEHMLRSEGYEVVGAEDGNQALSALEDAGPFDLLFTDIVLPEGMNGLEVAERARKRQPNIKILYATGYAENVTAYDGKLTPGVNLLAKPYLRTELIQMVRATLVDVHD